MTLTITERVAAGAAWLDENKPGWVERISLDKLDIESDCGCALGQVYGGYNDSPYTARWHAKGKYLAVERGFVVDILENDQRGAYAALTAEWKRIIQERRAVIAP